VVPGQSEKIVEMAEREQRHRHGLEEDDQQADWGEAKRGRLLGAAMMWLLVGSAVLVTFFGYWYVAIAPLATPVVQTIGKLIQRSETQEQRDES